MSEDGNEQFTKSKLRWNTVNAQNKGFKKKNPEKRSISSCWEFAPLMHTLKPPRSHWQKPGHHAGGSITLHIHCSCTSKQLLSQARCQATQSLAWHGVTLRMPPSHQENPPVQNPDDSTAFIRQKHPIAGNHNFSFEVLCCLQTLKTLNCVTLPSLMHEMP